MSRRARERAQIIASRYADAWDHPAPWDLPECEADMQTHEAATRPIAYKTQKQSSNGTPTAKQVGNEEQT